MKILQVIPVFSPSFGGPVTVVRSSSKELAKRHEVVVYTTTALDLRHDFEPKEEEVDGYKIHYFPRALKLLCYSYLFGQLNVSWDMMKAVKHNIRKFDVVHVHSWQQFPDMIVHHYAGKYNVPYVIQTHGSIPRIGKRFRKLLYDITLGYRVLNKASKVIALSKVEAEQYRSMGVPKEKIAIIPNGIDLSEYANLPPKDSFKKKFGIPEDRKIILYLGRIHKTKGIDILIKAYAYLKNKMNFKDAVLVIAGPDDGYLSEIKYLAQAFGVSNSILFVGPLYGEDKLAAYVDSEVYVLPSRYETFPMVVLEAYACGKPVIASNVGGLKELIIDSQTGLLFEAGNFKQMAEKIVYLLNDSDKAIEIGRKARILVEEKYSIDKVVDMIERLYSEVAL
jgi:glycosyltransferase involved in cell wall biosynthesis